MTKNNNSRNFWNEWMVFWLYFFLYVKKNILFHIKNEWNESMMMIIFFIKISASAPKYNRKSVIISRTWWGWSILLCRLSSYFPFLCKHDYYSCFFRFVLFGYDSLSSWWWWFCRNNFSIIIIRFAHYVCVYLGFFSFCRDPTTQIWMYFFVC